MKALFLSILEASLAGGIMIAAVLLLRLLLKRAGKQALCLLWLLVLVRLMIPFAPESPFSLQPDYALPYNGSITAQISSQITDEPVQTEPADTHEVSAPSVTIRDTMDLIDAAAWVWAAVACGMLLYTLGSYLRLKHRVRNAKPVCAQVFESDQIETAFLLGYFRPGIYLPAGMDEDNKSFIIAHERAHIARLDNWTKLLGFVCLGLHWFNPLVWAAYILLCRDIEMACDERVVRGLDVDARKAYSAALLSCSAGIRVIPACPVAFAEVGVKQRILSVLRYRKPGFWLKAVSAAAIAFAVVCFMTKPVSASVESPAPEADTPAATVPADTVPPATAPSLPPATEPATVPPTEPATEPVVPPTTVPPETVHSHTYTADTHEPTCTQNGYDLYTCACGESYHDNIVSAYGHDYRQTRVVEASFDSKGYTDFECTVCGDTTRGDYVDKWEKVDGDAAVAIAESYAQTLGFHIKSSGRTAAQGMTATAFPYHSGGQEHLVLLTKNAVRNRLAALKAEGADPADYDLWVWLDLGTVTTIHVCVEPRS